jgi:hypothetical protein
MAAALRGLSPREHGTLVEQVAIMLPWIRTLQHHLEED